MWLWHLCVSYSFSGQKGIKMRLVAGFYILFCIVKEAEFSTASDLSVTCSFKKSYGWCTTISITHWIFFYYWHFNSYLLSSVLLLFLHDFVFLLLYLTLRQCHINDEKKNFTIIIFFHWRPNNNKIHLPFYFIIKGR